MTAGLEHTSASAKATTWRLLVGLALIIAALTTADQFLARMQSAELRATAERNYSNGARLLQEGRSAEAIDFLRTAHALERQNQTYELELVQALVDSGKIADADPFMNDALEREPNDGETNLIAARLMAEKGQTVEAESYYHRAIYGEWPRDRADQRIAARTELIRWLKSRNNRQEMLAELIALEGEAPRDDGIQRQLARWFLDAGSPPRAAAVYRSLINRSPADVAAWEGLGEADLAEGDFRGARAAFIQASVHSPDSPSIRSGLDLVNELTALDPTPRQLPSREKYERSLRILSLARDRAGECASTNPEMNALLTGAQKTLANKAPIHIDNEAAERVLTLAEQIWRAGGSQCAVHTDSPEEQMLNLIMAKMGSR